ncbi:hypothetical protein, partial [Pseudomonas sp. DP16D-R1]|uniref:hypothetical protein n=1 Tax=Pseudomonas sp. DP16D-R1 TaxID=2075551 RepID=UPI000CD0C4B6
FLAMSFFTRNLDSDFSQDVLILGAIVLGIPVLILIHGLFREVPLPVRFNRQRREVCVPRDDGEYWIVPWETVTAAATQQSSVSQAGRANMGLLIIGFENPDPQAREDNKHFSLGFNCGGGTTAMALWECMRSYMEIGPEAVEDQTARFDWSKGIWATYLDDLVKAAKLRGWPLTLLWEGFCGIFIFNTLLIDVLERWKLNPPPDLPYPDITEWSKPLPPEQWAKRSPELEAAIAEREAELAAQAERELA